MGTHTRRCCKPLKDYVHVAHSSSPGVINESYSPGATAAVEAGDVIVAGLVLTVVSRPARRVALTHSGRLRIVQIATVSAEVAVSARARVLDFALASAERRHALAARLEELVGRHSADAFVAGASVLAGESHAVVARALVRVAVDAHVVVGTHALR